MVHQTLHENNFYCQSAPNVSARVLAPVVFLMILIWWC